MRIIILGALMLTLASAFVLYSSNYDTRQLEARVEEQERAIEKTRGDIAVLKAERAHLARPERIEPLARALGLGPASEQQLAATPEAALDRTIATGSVASAQKKKKGN
jgi:cell division protein FtsL